MAGEWTPGEDRRPAPALLRTQPELTARGRVWTQLTWFDLDGMKAYTQLTIREVGGDYLVSHGRIWPVTSPEDDAA